MNHDDEVLLERVGAELRRRAGDAPSAHLGVAEVRARAFAIRRRRRAGAALAVAAAVIAVLVPVGLLAQDGQQDLQPAPSPAPSPAPAPAPTPRPDGTFPLRLEGLDTGRGPAVSYVPNRGEPRVVTPEGVVPLEEHYRQAVRYGDGYLALGSGASPGPLDVRLHLLDAEHRFVDDLGPTSDRLVTSPDGTRVAWVEIGEDGSTTLAVASGGEAPERTALAESYAFPVGLLPDDGVLVGIQGPDQASYAVARDGGLTPLDGFDYLWDSSATTGLIAGQTGYDAVEDSQCAGTTQDGRATPLWEQCDLVLGDLSPRGDLVLGFRTPLLPHSAAVSVLDARTGEVLVRWSAPRGSATVVNATWEDDDTLLALVEQDGRQALVRGELDGRAELATQPATARAMSAELDFVERPMGAVR